MSNLWITVELAGRCRAEYGPGDERRR